MTLVLTLARACQAGHLKVTTPGSQMPLARQREHAAFQNTALAQQNYVRHAKSYDSRTGARKMTRFKSSKWHVFRFPSWNCDRDTHGHTRTLANAWGRKFNDSWSRPNPQTPDLRATRSGKNSTPLPVDSDALRCAICAISVSFIRWSFCRRFQRMESTRSSSLIASCRQGRFPATNRG